ncbi:RNA-binding S4 domain-containing protein [Collibacillus ludicampi]|jgi:ribosomal 50S subunit-recycling heat shock protein|uniref:RQC P-site tRNA stabilizing factor n=1 Tax=Collibacillus ludicampi TaxID=2771369 RepID=A0AAV4LE31_9BACL|nr:RNA-binding S4 domain-containing protein [Collibacillus ludicampi]GIM46052.1 RNA-binding S4 domain-containing protein [Collibacillus ludicampi]
MRLDKFLKVSRLIKRRTLAKEICDQGRIQINGRPAKASTEVRVDDVLTITFGTKIVEVKVHAIAEHVKKEQAAEMYTVLSETRKSGNPEWDDSEDDE